MSRFRPLVRRRSAIASLRFAGTGGATLAVRAHDALAGAAGSEMLRYQIFSLLAEQVPVAVSIDGLGAGSTARSRLARVCAGLRPAVDSAQSASRNVQVTIPAEIMTPLQAWSIRRRWLGPGRVNLLTRHARTRPRPGDGVDVFWRQLWQLRGHSELSCAVAAKVWPTCSLLAVEYAHVVEPWLGLLGPVGSAWVWAVLHVDAFADAAGRLDEAALERGLEHCVSTGDSLHDNAAWPTPSMRQDSWRNRRIAIVLYGFGEVIARRKLDPCTDRCHDELAQMLAWIRSVVTAHSRRLAIENELLPALNDNNPTLRLAPAARAGWQERWNRALETAAVRHRTLLALSPWSMIPAAPAAPAAYFDLLSLLETADACTFQPPWSIRHYNLQDFIDLYTHSSVALARRDARRLIAEQV